MVPGVTGSTWRDRFDLAWPVRPGQGNRVSSGSSPLIAQWSAATRPRTCRNLA